MERRDFLGVLLAGGLIVATPRAATKHQTTEPVEDVREIPSNRTPASPSRRGWWGALREWSSDMMNFAPLRYAATAAVMAVLFSAGIVFDPTPVVSMASEVAEQVTIALA